MELLQERIRREGRVLPGNIVKVDGFLNHRVDTRLLEDIADEFAKYFDTSKITVVLTAEASGIALATICAQKYGVPMLFAKKAKSDNIESGLYQSEVFSYTYKKRVTLLVSQEWLNADDHVLIIDDFMANGYAMRGLIDIEKAELQKQDPEKGMSFVDYMFWQYGSLEEVLEVHDNIQDSLDDLKENTDEDQIAVRVNIADYTARLRRWYRQYEEYCEVSRTDNSLAEAMESVLEWRKRRNNEVSG